MCRGGYGEKRCDSADGRAGRLPGAPAGPERSGGPDAAPDAAAEAPPPDPLRDAFAKAAAETGGGAVLGLPTSRLFVKILRLPAAVRGDLASAVALQMAKHAPFSGEDMTVAGEVVFQTDEEATVFAAVLPHAAVAQITPWLHATGLRVERVDALMLGWWRAVCAAVSPAVPAARRVFLAGAASEWDLIVADGERPVLARGLGAVADPQALARELTLSLLNVEIETGPAPLQEVVFFTAEAPDRATAEAVREALGAAVRHERPPQADADLAGLAARAAADEALPFNLLPDSWRVRNAARDAARRFWTGAVVFAAAWVLAAAALFGAPAFVRQRVKAVDRALAANKAEFDTVQNVRKRAALIESYMDRSDSVLEALRVAAERMPTGVELTGLTYRREEGLRLAGEATDPALVYRLKDALENTDPFGACTLTGVSLAADRRKHRFELICPLKQAEEEGAP